MMIDKEMQKLNDIIIYTKNNKKYSYLLEHEYIENIIMSACFRLQRENSYDLEMDEIVNKANVLVIEMLEKFNDGLEDEYLSASFVSYINKYLYYRLLDKREEYVSIFDGDTASIESMGIPHHFVPSCLQTEGFEQELVDSLSIKKIMDEILSQREYDTIQLLFFEGYNTHEVAEKFGVTESTVYTLKYRSFKKIKSFL